MVQEILKNIDLKVQAELEKISQEKNKAILGLEKNFEKEKQQKREKAKQELEKKAKNEIAEFLQQKRTELKFAVLKEKNKIISQAYQKAVRKISELKDQEFEKWIKSLVPKNVLGKIQAGKRTANVLKFLDLQIENDLKEEGFLVISDELDLDFRVSQVLERLKQEQEPEIIKLLFE